MSTDEQRVRTMAGWIGVEISRSRVRTPGKPGYGLYRVRGERNTAAGWVKSEWTAYALGLGAVRSAVETSIRNGAPSGPGSFITGAGVVPTRWTAAYRGRRDLGVAAPVALRREFGDQVEAVAALVDAGSVAMTHTAGCDCSGTERLTAACVRATIERETVRSRQRAANAAFQAEHRERRDYGLRRRHAEKLARGGSSTT